MTFINVELKPNACCYLKYMVDLKSGRFNYYECDLKDTSHSCCHWGECPIYDTFQTKDPETKKMTSFTIWDLK
jgi:hypothetical protein